MILFINTTDRQKAILALIAKDKVSQTSFVTSRRLSEILPIKLKAFLKKHKVSPATIKSIVVVRGPGAFMSVRTGVAYVNALSQALNIPSKGITVDEIPQKLTKLLDAKTKKEVITPKYGSPPHITKPKAR